jgi:hypothetical protein
VGGTYQDPVPDKFHTPIIWYALENAQNEDYWKDVDISKVVMILRSGKDERYAGISILLRKWNINRVVGRSIQHEAINFITVEFPNPTRERVLNFLREAKENPDVIVAEPEVIHRKIACPLTTPIGTTSGVLTQFGQIPPGVIRGGTRWLWSRF